MSGYRSPWAVLGIEQTNDDRAIRKAYSAKLKQLDVEADPAAFIALREAMEHARQWAMYNAQADDEDDDDYFDEDYDDDHYGNAAGQNRYGSANENRDVAPHQPQRDRVDGIEILLSPTARLQLVAEQFAAGTAPTASVLTAPIPPVADIPHYAGGDLVPPVQRRKMNVAAERAIPLPWQSCATIFPDQTPLLADMLRRRVLPQATPEATPATTKAAPLYPPIDAAPAAAEVFTHEGSAAPSFPLYPAIDEEPAAQEPSNEVAQGEPSFPLYPPVDIQPEAAHETVEQAGPKPPPVNLDTLYPHDEEPDYARWADFQGAVSFRRDDWGNADRERLAELLNGKSYGPAEAAEVERLTDILLTSDHLDALDYRDFMENWIAAIIAETLPRSDGVLAKASTKFLWGTEAGQLHHSYALDTCFARNRDIEAERKLSDPAHKWHKVYRVLKQPAPEKLSSFSGIPRQDVQIFLDTMRVERPTLEWSLDRNHVALWDAEINSKLDNVTGQDSGGIKWYHILFLIFIAIQVMARLPASTPAPPPPPPIEQPVLTDYQALFEDNEPELAAREHLAGPFNAAFRKNNAIDPSDTLLGNPTLDLSRYLSTDDLFAYVTDACDAACSKRVGEMRLAFSQRKITDPDQSDATQTGEHAPKNRAKFFGKRWDEMSANERTALERAVANARRHEEIMSQRPPPPPPVSPPSMLLPTPYRGPGMAPVMPHSPIPAAIPAKTAPPKAAPAKAPSPRYQIEWTYSASDPNRAPTVALTPAMKAIGFTKRDTDKLSKYMTRKSDGKGGYSWECGPPCVKYADYVVSREERLRYLKPRAKAD